MAEIKIIARPWRPQDLIDDLQEIIDEESDNYLNTRRTTLCMALDFLKEHFAEQKWIPVTERLPKYFDHVLINAPGDKPFTTVHEAHLRKDGLWDTGLYRYDREDVTHWMPLPQPPKGE